MLALALATPQFAAAATDQDGTADAQQNAAATAPQVANEVNSTSSGLGNMSYLNLPNLMSMDGMFTYTLTLDANGGSIDGHESPWVVESVNTDDTSHVFNGIPSVGMNRDGYTFKGWSLDPHATTPTYDPGYVIGANSDKTAYTLYAVWQKDEEPQPPATQFTYSLTLDANGGAFDGHENPWVVQSVDTDDTSFIFDGIPSDVPTRDGYTFKGWSLESDGSGVEYDPGYVIGANSDKTACTLYAQWQKNNETPVNPTDPTKPTDPTQPTEPTNPTEPTTPATPQEPAADETEGSVDEVADADNEAEGDEESDQNALAETSDPMSAAPIAGIALASGAALIAARKKLNGRHNN